MKRRVESILVARFSASSSEQQCVVLLRPLFIVVIRFINKRHVKSHRTASCGINISEMLLYSWMIKIYTSKQDACTEEERPEFGKLFRRSE